LLFLGGILLTVDNFNVNMEEQQGGQRDQRADKPGFTCRWKETPSRLLNGMTWLQVHDVSPLEMNLPGRLAGSWVASSGPLVVVQGVVP
jgi:hypothetical protein